MHDMSKGDHFFYYRLVSNRVIFTINFSMARAVRHGRKRGRGATCGFTGDCMMGTWDVACGGCVLVHHHVAHVALEHILTYSTLRL